MMRFERTPTYVRFSCWRLMTQWNINGDRVPFAKRAAPYVKHGVLMILALQFIFAGATALVGWEHLPPWHSWQYFAWLVPTLIAAELWPCAARSPWRRKATVADPMSPVIGTGDGTRLNENISR